MLEKVRYSEWAAPIVPVVKPDKSIRICGDYKVTVSSVLEVDQHPLPNPEQLFVELSEGEKFTKLDLSQAYQQILLDEDSRQYVTINTHKGLYRPTRLPFGVTSASAIFQSKIEQMLQGIPMVACRVDDITLGINAAKNAEFSLSVSIVMLRHAVCVVPYFMLELRLLHGKLKMATGNFSVEEVLNVIFEDENCEIPTNNPQQAEREDDEEKGVRGKIYLANYIAGSTFNKDMFTSTAPKLFTPLLRACESQDSKFVNALLSWQINSKTCLAHESSLWLAGMFRKLGRRRSIRRSFYGEIHRDIPVYIFNALFEAIKLSKDEDFRAPLCYVKGNSKGKIISFATKSLVVKMFCLLSDRSEDYVNGFPERQLGGQRKGFTRKGLIATAIRVFIASRSNL